MKTIKIIDIGVVTYRFSEKDLTGKDYCVMISFTSSELEGQRKFVLDRVRRVKDKLKNKINTINEGIINGCVSGNGVYPSVVSQGL
jgi:hypothetical protein